MKPKISIMIITYNHVNFIAKAIESVLCQETEYDFEINIIEDCSTDGTQNVIREYQERFPNKIKAFLNPKNIGSTEPPPQKVFSEGFKTLTGDYISILEGDDYWNSPKKIQTQVSFLESHRDFVACAHNTIKIYEDGTKAPHRFLYWEEPKQVHTIHDFIAMTSFFHTSSIIYRNVLKGIPPKQFRSKWSCDIFNTMAHVQHGPLKYFCEDWSVYRSHKNGNFSTMSDIDGRIYNIEGLQRYNLWLRFKFHRGFCFTIHRLCEDLLRLADKSPAALDKRTYKRYGRLMAIYGLLHFLASFEIKKLQVEFKYRVHIVKCAIIGPFQIFWRMRPSKVFRYELMLRLRSKLVTNTYGALKRVVRYIQR